MARSSSLNTLPLWSFAIASALSPADVANGGPSLALSPAPTLLDLDRSDALPTSERGASRTDHVDRTEGRWAIGTRQNRSRDAGPGTDAALRRQEVPLASGRRLQSKLPRRRDSRAILDLR